MELHGLAWRNITMWVLVDVYDQGSLQQRAEGYT